MFSQSSTCVSSHPSPSFVRVLAVLCERFSYVWSVSALCCQCFSSSLSQYFGIVFCRISSCVSTVLIMCVCQMCVIKACVKWCFVMTTEFFARASVVVSQSFRLCCKICNMFCQCFNCFFPSVCYPGFRAPAVLCQHFGCNFSEL